MLNLLIVRNFNFYKYKIFLIPGGIMKHFIYMFIFVFFTISSAQTGKESIFADVQKQIEETKINPAWICHKNNNNIFDNKYKFLSYSF